ncbi:hypothetical protein [Maribacter stanieri]|uniref:hypothetical protein n=1 Tax=Maribacter stanieri TaxID=440514 RepID=UPI0024949329|nr:hypothetical protein [Maribacter stanieri]
MEKFRDFAPTLSDLKEYLFVQKKDNELECFEVKIADYDKSKSTTFNGLILEATEVNDRIIFTKTTPNQYIQLDRNDVESIHLIS